jgi:enhancing lycopene biosynthesis protein 2
MMTESARITRGSKGLYEIKNMKVDSLKALIIPSFLDKFDEELVLAVVNIPEIRDCIKECNMK